MAQHRFMRDPSASLQQTIERAFFVPEEGADPWPNDRRVQLVTGRRALMVFIDENGPDGRQYRLGQASVWAHPYWHGREQQLLSPIAVLPEGKTAQAADMYFAAA